MGIGLEGIGSGSEDSEGGVRRTFRGGGSSDDSEGVRVLRAFRGGGSSDSEDSDGGGVLGLVRLLTGVGAGFGTLRLGVGNSSNASSIGSATSSTTASTIATGLGRFLLPGGRPGLRVAILDIAIFSIRTVAEYRFRR